MSAHLPNGNPIREHSAGETFPYVIARQEHDDYKVWIVIGPKCPGGITCHSYDAAQTTALSLKRADITVEFLP